MRIRWVRRYGGKIKGPKFPYSVENTGMTFALVKAFPAYIASTPTSGNMQRPN